MGKSYRDLKVWDKAVELAVQVYSFTSHFPKQEVYGLSSQMRRASVSIASNIAEGSARGTRKDFRHFVKLAKGSNAELQTQLLIARRLGFRDDVSCDGLETLSTEIGMMLTGLNQYLEREVSSKKSPASNQLATDN